MDETALAMDNLIKLLKPKLDDYHHRYLFEPDMKKFLKATKANDMLLTYTVIKRQENEYLINPKFLVSLQRMTQISQNQPPLQKVELLDKEIVYDFNMIKKLEDGQVFETFDALYEKTADTMYKDKLAYEKLVSLVIVPILKDIKYQIDIKEETLRNATKPFVLTRRDDYDNKTNIQYLLDFLLVRTEVIPRSALKKVMFAANKGYYGLYKFSKTQNLEDAAFKEFVFFQIANNHDISIEDIVADNLYKETILKLLQVFFPLEEEVPLPLTQWPKILYFQSIYYDYLKLQNSLDEYSLNSTFEEVVNVYLNQEVTTDIDDNFIKSLFGFSSFLLQKSYYDCRNIRNDLRLAFLDKLNNDTTLQNWFRTALSEGPSVQHKIEALKLIQQKSREVLGLKQDAQEGKEHEKDNDNDADDNDEKTGIFDIDEILESKFNSSTYNAILDDGEVKNLKRNLYASELLFVIFKENADAAAFINPKSSYTVLIEDASLSEVLFPSFDDPKINVVINPSQEVDFKILLGNATTTERLIFYDNESKFTRVSSTKTYKQFVDGVESDIIYDDTQMVVYLNSLSFLTEESSLLFYNYNQNPKLGAEVINVYCDGFYLDFYDILYQNAEYLGLYIYFGENLIVPFEGKQTRQIDEYIKLHKNIARLSMVFKSKSSDNPAMHPLINKYKTLAGQGYNAILQDVAPANVYLYALAQIQENADTAAQRIADAAVDPAPAAATQRRYRMNLLAPDAADAADEIYCEFRICQILAPKPKI
jgi:hypothetical protein